MLANNSDKISLSHLPAIGTRSSSLKQRLLSKQHPPRKITTSPSKPINALVHTTLIACKSPRFFESRHDARQVHPRTGSLKNVCGFGSASSKATSPLCLGSFRRGGGGGGDACLLTHKCAASAGEGRSTEPRVALLPDLYAR